MRNGSQTITKRSLFSILGEKSYDLSSIIIVPNWKSSQVYVNVAMVNYSCALEMLIQMSSVCAQS